MPMWVWEAARLVYKHAMFVGAADDDTSMLIRHVEGAPASSCRSCDRHSYANDSVIAA